MSNQSYIFRTSRCIMQPIFHIIQFSTWLLVLSVVLNSIMSALCVFQSRLCTWWPESWRWWPEACWWSTWETRWWRKAWRWPCACWKAWWREAHGWTTHSWWREWWHTATCWTSQTLTRHELRVRDVRKIADDVPDSLLLLLLQ